MVLEAGELREWITIQKPQRTPNGSGGYETVYVDVLTTYAKAEEKSADANIIASQENIDNLVEFTLRYRSDVYIKNGYRLVWRNNNFKVNRFKVDRLRTTITITVKSEIETTER